MLYIFSGLPGVGKSTLAKMLSKERNACYLRIDTIERALWEYCRFKAEGEGYNMAYLLAKDNLQLGRVVVADSCNTISLTRKAWENVARELNINYINIQIICSDIDEHKRRVELRRSAHPKRGIPTWDNVKKRHYEKWGENVITVDTAGRSEKKSFLDLLEKLNRVRT